MIDGRYQHKFNILVARIVLKMGNVVRINHDAFGVHGWDDTNATGHLRQCNITSHSIPYDGEWEEQPSLSSRGPTVSGLIVKHIECQCGFLHDRKVRMECDMVTLAEQVFMEMQIICENLHG